MMNLLTVRKMSALVFVFALALLFQNCGKGQANDSLQEESSLPDGGAAECTVTNSQGSVVLNSYLNWGDCEADCINAIKTDAQTTCELGQANITPTGT